MATALKHKSNIRFTIRPMVYSDLSEVVQLEQHIFSDPWSLQSFAESLIEERVGAWVAEIHNQVIGYMVTLWIESEIHILNLAVADKYRRRGVASRMLSNIENLALENNSSHFWLEVRSSNLSAQHFYNTHGFKPLGQRKKYYRNGEDALIMAKPIGDVE